MVFCWVSMRKDWEDEFDYRDVLTIVLVFPPFLSLSLVKLRDGIEGVPLGWAGKSKDGGCLRCCRDF